jgi:hypothetical protein
VKSSGVEAYPNEMMVSLISGTATAKEQWAKEAEKARLAKEAEERRIENEKQVRLLARVTNFLAEKAEKYEKLAKIECLERFPELAGNTPENGWFPELKSAFDLVLVNLRHQISAESLNEEIVHGRLLDKERWY